MNQLIIIGNGFDLAHGLKTSYKDFILYELNKACANPTSKFNPETDLISVEPGYKPDYMFNRVEQFYDFIKHWKSDVSFNPFFQDIIQVCNSANWVDIEKMYFRKLQRILHSSISNNSFDLNYLLKDRVIELNKSLDLIKTAFHNYLIDTYEIPVMNNSSIYHHIDEIINLSLLDRSSEAETTHILNFNYTPTIENYIKHSIRHKTFINYIHGKIDDENNRIIFGYGDETDAMYSKIEDFDENELTRNMKSFHYMLKPNYQILFDFIEKGDFAVNIMGHSCGISDRVLFNNIFKNEKLKQIQIYYHQRSEANEDNDFFEKTQNLSRYFDSRSKHLMRTKIIPFTKCSPLTTPT